MFSAIDTVWVLLGAALVFFMQAGFAMVESGFGRAKNAGNIIMKNVMDFACGSVAFWVVGFGLMFAGSGKLIGGLDLFATGNYATDTVPSLAIVIFQTVFCATAATIVSGAMAGRTKFFAYCICSVVLTALIYPVSGHWIWGGGWLSELGFHDFAGSTTVHMVGGVAALVGAKVVGPRIGKYKKDGTPNVIGAHSMTLAALGVFILWFGWFGFNGGSTLGMEGTLAASAGSIFMTTNIAAAVSTTAAMAFTWIRYGKPDVSMTLNGTLAGLVAITAGCDVVTPIGAMWIGLIAGIVMIGAVELMDQVFKIDDPVGAIAVHGVCGALGTVLTGLFSTQQGLLYGHGFSFLGVQCLGVLAVMVWVAVTMSIVFLIVHKTIGLRVSRAEEIVGLDVSEHALQSSYADFMPLHSTAIDQAEKGAAILNMRINPDDYVSDGVLRKVVIVTRATRLTDLKDAMNDIGVTGITVTNVMGFGNQKGNEVAYYRGVSFESILIPKIQMEIVICEVPLQIVLDTARKVLYTGKAGDGKIFVYQLEDVIRIRTDQTGKDAL